MHESILLTQGPILVAKEPILVAPEPIVAQEPILGAPPNLATKMETRPGSTTCDYLSGVSCVERAPEALEPLYRRDTRATTRRGRCPSSTSDASLADARPRPVLHGRQVRLPKCPGQTARDLPR